MPLHFNSHQVGTIGDPATPVGAKDFSPLPSPPPAPSPPPPSPPRHRRSIRLRGYDYSRAGAYFVTICTHQRQCLFGEIVNGEMRLNDTGKTAQQCWYDISGHFPQVELDGVVIMPNHIHGILLIGENTPEGAVGAKKFSPLPFPLSLQPTRRRPRGTAKTLGSIVRGFKIGLTKWVRQNTAGGEVWQRNYWEHIIRDDAELHRIRGYIQNNPAQWAMDELNPVGAKNISPLHPATYGGAGWQPRTASQTDELARGEIWRSCGVSSEWEPLLEVVLHWPGEELNFSGPPDHQLMLARPDLDQIRRQTEGLAAIYEREGVAVHLTNLCVGAKDFSPLPPPNFLFQRDLFWPTPQGVVLARPAARQRAGEERCMAQVLAGLAVPVLFHPFGSATFEGADALWLDSSTVLLGSGVRTNRAAVAQLCALLAGMGVEMLEVALPTGIQHLLGVVNFVDHDLAVLNGGKVTDQLVELLSGRGIRKIVLPPDAELTAGLGMNFVTLSPRRLLMPAGCPGIRARFRSEGLAVLEAEIGEYRKAAGGIGCLTGILRRG